MTREVIKKNRQGEVGTNQLVAEQSFGQSVQPAAEVGGVA